MVLSSLNPNIIKNLANFGVKNLNAYQNLVLPDLLQLKNVVMAGEPGCGKTSA